LTTITLISPVATLTAFVEEKEKLCIGNRVNVNKCYQKLTVRFSQEYWVEFCKESIRLLALIDSWAAK